MSRPVFVSEDAVKQMLAWPAMIAKLREVYAAEHPPFAGPPRTLARGKGMWMRTVTESKLGEHNPSFTPPLVCSVSKPPNSANMGGDLSWGSWSTSCPSDTRSYC